MVFVRDVRASGFEWNSHIFVAPKKAEQLKAHAVEPGDLVATKMGFPPCIAAEYPSWMQPGIVTADIVRMRPDRRKVYIRWLVNVVNGLDVQAQVRTITGGITRPKITLRDFRELRIPLPPFPEQQSIAQILDTLDDAILKTEQLIAKLKQLKQGLLHDLLTRGVDKNGELRDPERCPEHFQGSSLGLIPSDWAVSPLSALAHVDRGKFGHRPRNDPAYYGGRYPFIQTGDITAAQGSVLMTYSQTLNDRGASVSREFPADTIAITIAANIADTAILGIPMYFPDSVVGAVVMAPNVPRFVELSIRRAKRELDARAPESAQKNINLQDLRPLRVPCPRPHEQERIAGVYDAATKRIESEVQSLKKLRLLKQGLMDDLLTGRVRVIPLLRKPTP